ncbi:MAG: hypothetical protein PHE53_02215 [Thermoguttaceae bacterium]|nr:hypothetical protein [Thermoguttaceae bacterium]
MSIRFFGTIHSRHGRTLENSGPISEWRILQADLAYGETFAVTRPTRYV